MKFIDLFSGIGGFRLGMEMAGHECVGHCEIDKYADKSYRAMHKVKESEFFANDIRTIIPRELPEFDIICAGFPCQSFSIAGNRGGFEDTRGTLFFEIARIIQERKPKIVFLENVRGLLSHDRGRTFGTILSTFSELGYDVEWQICNSRAFNLPHNRERIFIIGHLRGECRQTVFPIKTHNLKIVKGFQGDVSGKGYASQQDRVYFLDSAMGCLPASQTKSKTVILLPDGRLRSLTPKECFRLQGFPDELFEKANAVNSDSQLYKQAGNSVTVNVIYEIAKRLANGNEQVDY